MVQKGGKFGFQPERWGQMEKIALVCYVRSRLIFFYFFVKLVILAEAFPVLFNVLRWLHAEGFCKLLPEVFDVFDAHIKCRFVHIVVGINE